jgi:hypothetical protein
LLAAGGPVGRQQLLRGALLEISAGCIEEACHKVTLFIQGKCQSITIIKGVPPLEANLGP